MYLNISEIFRSIQGESTYIGLPCVFVRTQGCNLSCNYCDTKYSVETHKNASLQMSIKEILFQINSYQHTNLVQITGGEPLFQENIYDLMQSLHKQNFTILLETNGSIDLSKVPNYVCKIVDIKTPSSGHSDSFLIENLRHINPLKDNLKLVLSDLNDYIWMKNFLELHNLYGWHILISTAYNTITPSIITNNIINDNLNVRFQIQLHKYINIV